MTSPKKITSWSFSRWSQYEECPFKAKLKFIDKLKEPGSPAMDRGTDIHQKAEKYVGRELKTLPVELHNLKAEFTEVRKNKEARVELQLAFDRGWNSCDWMDWDRCWVRIKVDLLEPPNKEGGIRVVDYKTGKFRPVPYGPQLELYAIGGLLQYEEAQYALTQLWFTDEGIVHPSDKSKEKGVFQRKELPKLIKLWEKRVTPMLSDTKFAPKPGNYCRWCSFSKAKGGPCRF